MSGYWYLGSPYSRYPRGIYKAHRDVCKEAGRLTQAGVAVYSPIANSHPIAMIAGLDPLDHDLWMTADQPLMDTAKGLIVLKMEGWDQSHGLAYEIEIFTAMGLPVIYMEPGTIPEELRHER
jgi:hypothetical protein